MAGAGLQARIDALLHESPDEPRTAFSPYANSASDLVEALWAAGDAGDDAEAAMTAALDLAEASTDDRARVRHAVQILITNHPRARQLGLRVPPLVERAPHLTWPSKRDKT